MPLVTRDSLMTLEAYAKARPEYRKLAMAHKRARSLSIGEHLTLLFEDEFTVRYQIQEMLRIEKTFEEQGIQDELDAYNPLIPTGREFKATMMIEFPDADERRRELRRLKGIERLVWIRIGDGAKRFAIADEDLERENDEKTSSVHFLRFPLEEAEAQALKSGAKLAAGVDHDNYRASADPVPAALQTLLLKDLA